MEVLKAINALKDYADKNGMLLDEVAELFNIASNYILECHDRGITVDQHLNKLKGDNNDSSTS